MAINLINIEYSSTVDGEKLSSDNVSIADGIPSEALIGAAIRIISDNLSSKLREIAADNVSLSDIGRGRDML